MIDPEIRTGVGANDLYSDGQEAQAGRLLTCSLNKILSFGIQAKFKKRLKIKYSITQEI